MATKKTAEKTQKKVEVTTEKEVAEQASRTVKIVCPKSGYIHECSVEDAKALTTTVTFGKTNFTLGASEKFISAEDAKKLEAFTKGSNREFKVLRQPQIIERTDEIDDGDLDDLLD